MGKQLVIVGAGHAHLTILKNLQEFTDAGHEVTVVSSSSLHYYSGMGPGMLSGIYRPEEIRFNVKKMSEDRGAVFIEDKVVKIHPQKKEDRPAIRPNAALRRHVSQHRQFRAGGSFRFFRRLRNSG